MNKSYIGNMDNNDNSNNYNNHMNNNNNNFYLSNSSFTHQTPPKPNNHPIPDQIPNQIPYKIPHPNPIFTHKPTYTINNLLNNYKNFITTPIPHPNHKI